MWPALLGASWLFAIGETRRWPLRAPVDVKTTIYLPLASEVNPRVGLLVEAEDLHGG